MSDITAKETLLKAKQVRLAEIREINARLEKLGVETAKPKKIKTTTTKKVTTTTTKTKTKSKTPIVATVSSMKLYLTSQDVKYNTNATKAELEIIIRDKFMVRKVNEFHKTLNP